MSVGACRMLKPPRICKYQGKNCRVIEQEDYPLAPIWSRPRKWLGNQRSRECCRTVSKPAFQWKQSSGYLQSTMKFDFNKVDVHRRTGWWEKAETELIKPESEWWTERSPQPCWPQSSLMLTTRSSVIYLSSLWQTVSITIKSTENLANPVNRWRLELKFLVRKTILIHAISERLDFHYIQDHIHRW